MPTANAKEKGAAVKAAEKKLASNGVTKPKHKPGESAPGVKAVWPQSGVDTGSTSVVQLSSPTTTESKMDVNKAEKANADAKAADKKAAMEAAAKAKAEKAAKAAAEKEAKAKEKAEAAAKAKTEREAKQAAALEARKANAEGTKRTYFGTMTALADRVKSGAYTKGLTGQLRSSDPLAVALDAVPTDNVIQLALKVLGLETMPANYVALNRGQQLMNLRNKLRGALKANEGKGLVVGDKTVTLEYIKEVRDANGYATAEDAAAKKAEAKAKREKEASEKKAAAEAAKAAAKEAKAKPAEAVAA